jgi:hypothetical protein
VNRFRTIAITAIAGFVLVACGPSASASSGAGASEPPASQAAGQSQGEVQPPFSAGVVADLEALIPDTVGGITMQQKISMRGSEFLVAPGSDPAAVKFIQDLGVSPSDISMATGSGANSTTGDFVVMFLVRAAGANSSALISAFETAMNTGGSSPLQWTDGTVGGKHVQVAATGTASTYVYAKGDTVFWILANEANATEVLSGLP